MTRIASQINGFRTRASAIVAAVALLAALPAQAQDAAPPPDIPAPQVGEAPAGPGALSAPATEAAPALPSPSGDAPPAATAPAPSLTQPAPQAPAAGTGAGTPAQAEGAAAPGAAGPAQAAAEGAGASAATGPASAAPVPQAGPDTAAALRSPDPATLPHDLSPWGMFMAADWVVKAVMIGLAFASLVTWTVLIAKSLEIAFASRRAGRTIAAIRDVGTLSEALAATARHRGPAAFMLRTGDEEYRRSAPVVGLAGPAGVKERVASALTRIEVQAGRRLARGTGLLATIGSTAPFVGLFGTVWGIMNSFIGISEAQTTNLAVVAPGIAEALLATALGLVAAIPAVMIYNAFARAISGYRQRLGDAAAAVERLVSRDLDFRRMQAPPRPAAVGA